MALIVENTPRHGQTVVSTAYNRLRNDIMRGVLAPGQKLKFNVLSEAYGVGMGTLREALHKLAADGLVEAEERRGFTVEPITADQLIDTPPCGFSWRKKGCAVRSRFGDVESEVAVCSAPTAVSKAGARRWLGVRKTSTTSGRSITGTSTWRWSPPAARRHSWIFAVQYSPVRNDTPACRSPPNCTTPRLHSITSKRRRALKDAALARDADRAAILLRKHFEGTRDLLLDWLARRNPKGSPRTRRLQKQTRKAD